MPACQIFGQSTWQGDAISRALSVQHQMEMARLFPSQSLGVCCSGTHVGIHFNIDRRNLHKLTYSFEGCICGSFSIHNQAIL